MKQDYKIALSKIVEEFHFEVLVRPEKFEEIMVETPEVNRPGLALAGFYGDFKAERIQLIGKAETSYLQSIEPSTKRVMLQKFVDAHPVAILYTTNLPADQALIERAEREQIPVLRTDVKTSPIMSSLIASLNNYLAPRITRHGGLVEVYGEGLLLLGDSGVGKSETAIELVKRGHRLVADDAVELRKVSNRQIMGTAPENIRHFIELRGIGIVNVARVFGVGAVKLSESLDLVVQLEAWDPTKNYQRTGLENEYYDILGVSIPSTSIPVSPGRNLAVVLETAAINNRQKKMGYNAAKELLIRLGLDDKLD